MTGKLKEKIRNAFEIAISGGAEVGGSVLSEMLSSALVGQFAPGLVIAFMSYKQKRTEKMVMAAITDISGRLKTLEDKLSRLSSEDWLFIKESFLPVFLDAIASEQQEDKVSLLVNGFQTAIEYQLTDMDIIILYYDIMMELRVLDLKTLMWLTGKSDVEAFDEMSISHDDVHQSSMNHIVKKLENLHLIGLQKRWADFGGNYTINRERVELTVLGERFVDFFRMGGGL